MPDMHVVALTHHTGRRLAEIGFLVAGMALAGVFLIIATHWGHFG
jgi:hypothetical protein